MLDRSSQSSGRDVASINLNNDVNRVTGNLVVHNNILTRPNSSFGTIFYTVNGNQSSYNAFIATVKGALVQKTIFKLHTRVSESSTMERNILTRL